MKMHLWIRSGLLTFLVSLVAGPATATIINATNAVDISGFPLGMDVSDGSAYGSAPSGPGEGARYFTESTRDLSGVGFNVVNPMDATLYGPGHTSNPGSYGPGTVGQSHYIFWDPIQAPPSGFHTSVFDFDAPIIAILWSGVGLADTDLSLGLAGVSYGGAFPARGLEDHPGVPQDSIVLSAGGTTLTFDARAGTPGDWFRVVTAVSTVPEPSSVLLTGLGLMGLLSTRHRGRR